MPVSDNGNLIIVATSSIHSEIELSEEEKQIADRLAPLFRQAERNWIPAFIYERSRRNYVLVENAVVYEATVRAEMDIIYCIQIDAKDEELPHLLSEMRSLTSSQSAPSSGGSDPGVSVNLVKRIESIESKLSTVEAAISELCTYLIPDTQLDVNNEPESEIRAKLSSVPGLSSGTKTLDSVVADLIAKRPFRSDKELRSKVEQLPETIKSGKPSKKGNQLFEAIKKTYKLVYIAPHDDT